MALAAAGLVDRAFARRGRALAAAIVRGDLTPVADTRLRFLRRAVNATIVLLGLAVALSQFTALDRLATSVLASGAIAAAVIGFAARQTLANAVAGVLLAITQPLRVGDHVTFEGESGVVEDLRLAYTYLRSGDEYRIVIPNERLAAGVLRNDTIVTPAVSARASLWIPPWADTDAAVAALTQAVADAKVEVTEVLPDGVRLTIAVAVPTPGARAAREAELRAEGLRCLRSAGLLPAGAEGSLPGGRTPS